MLNSTSTGGGVAEMLPAHIALLCDLGLDVRWAVMRTEVSEFFTLTKRLHNLIHGERAAHPGQADRTIYDAVTQQNADQLAQHIKADDILVVHDPQPLGVGALLINRLGLRAIWRCHIGLDESSEHARAAWDFLAPYTEPYQHVVFSAADYVPGFLRERASVVHPTIDPLGHKNRVLSLHKLVGILCDAALAVSHWPLLDPPFPSVARRLQDDGSFHDATLPDDIGLLARPIITQVSRWDRLKGFAPLLAGFERLKQNHAGRPIRDDRHRRRLGIVRLVLAGPDPEGVTDDPEGLSVMNELREQYLRLAPDIRKDVALVTLPMQSVKQNALMVNALQRSSDIVVQNSLREGFGLTVSEAMWKRIPVLASARACGIRLQVRDGVEGRLAPDPEDPESLAALMHDMLSDPGRLEHWGRNAQRRVHNEFLIFSELRRWLQLFAQVTE
jgi:trehalose synthase